METNEKTIDLLNVFNYVICHIKQIVIITIVFMILGLGVGVVKDKKSASSNEKTVVTDSTELIDGNETYYYSTAKILFKCDSVQSVEKKYDVTSGQLQEQEVNERNTNCAFLNNSTHIFASDTTLLELMETYKYDDTISKFRKNISVERIEGTDVVRIVVRADDPKIAEEMVNYIVKNGIEETGELYQLNYKIIDQYTDYDNSFTDLGYYFGEKVEKAESMTIAKTPSVVKTVFFSTILGLLISVFYYVFKFILNNNVEDIDYIENNLKTTVLQALVRGNNDYAITSSKLINVGHKKILLTNIKDDSDLEQDAKAIASAMKVKNKKSLILVVSDKKENICSEGVLYVTYDCLESALKENESMYDFIFVVSSNADKNSETILVSKLVESVLLIIKCNNVKKDELYRVISDFSKYGNVIDAIVMKDITKESSSYKYAK